MIASFTLGTNAHVATWGPNTRRADYTAAAISARTTAGADQQTE